MRSMHAPAVTRNVERSASELPKGSHNCGVVVALIGSEPTKLDQIGSHFRPDFNAHDDVTLPAALSGAAHADGGG